MQHRQKRCVRSYQGMRGGKKKKEIKLNDVLAPPPQNCRKKEKKCVYSLDNCYQGALETHLNPSASSEQPSKPRAGGGRLKSRQAHYFPYSTLGIFDIAGLLLWTDGCDTRTRGNRAVKKKQTTNQTLRF